MAKKIPDEFDLEGDTTKNHVLLGEPKNPGRCAEKLAVYDAWNNKFGHYPNTVYVDRERIKVKDEGKWWWAAPTDQQIENLMALDNGRRNAVKAHSWKVSMIKMADVVPMSRAVRKKLSEYNKNRKHPSEREPTTRKRIDGLTRMVSK